MIAKQLRFNIPAFSEAISANVSPRYCWWSIEIGVITVIFGWSITLVASNLPPKPTSNNV